jgi:hypothetical protein
MFGITSLFVTSFVERVVGDTRAFAGRSVQQAPRRGGNRPA